MSNNKYIIRVGHPILRPGLTIETEASEAYVVDVMQATMAIARDFNHPTPPEFSEEDQELESGPHSVPWDAGTFSKETHVQRPGEVSKSQRKARNEGAARAAIQMMLDTRKRKG